MRRKRGQHRVEQATFDGGHRGVDIAGRVDDGVEGSELRGPRRGRGYVACDWRRAPFTEFRCRDGGAGEARHDVPARHEFAHHSRTDRARPTKYKNAHDRPLRGSLPIERAAPRRANVWVEYCAATTQHEAAILNFLNRSRIKKFFLKLIRDPRRTAARVSLPPWM